MSYQVPQHIDKNKIFIVKRSEIEGRLEPEFYKPSIACLEAKIRSLSSKRLRDYALSFAGGVTPKKSEGDKYYSDAENGVPFLRVQNLQTTGELSLDGCIYINEDTHNGLLKRSQVSEGDLLIKITGVGRMAIAAVAPKDFVGNTNQHMVVVKTGNTDISKYLARYLNLDIIEKIASRHSTGGTRPALDYPSLKNIPIIEGLDFSLIDDAIKAKKEKDKKAQQLLDSIDDYLLSELGIKLSSIETGIENRIFNINLSSIKRDRLDSDYFDAKYRNFISCIHKGRYTLYALDEVSSFISTGQTPKSDCYTENVTEYPIIKVGSYTGFEIDLNKISYTINKQTYSVQKGDIFILSAAHQAEYIAKQISYLSDTPAPNTSFVGELLCVRSQKSVNSMYLYSLLSTTLYKTLLNREKRGQTSHLYSQDVKQILVPIPPIEKQNDIAEHIENIRLQAKILQKDGSTILENAKREVEQMIIEK